MEKRLVQSLLNIYHSDKDSFQPGKAVMQFMAEHNLGRYNGKRVQFSPEDKRIIALLLQQRAGVNAARTTARQWDEITRIQSLKQGSDEKYSSKPVREQRIAVKALPQGALMLGQETIQLPPGANLDLDWQQLASLNRHNSILVVENWEAFSCLHQTTLDLSVAGENPLVIFRGSPFVYREDVVLHLLTTLKLPVYAFVDLDPAGLMIASTLPGFEQMILPEETELLQLLSAANNQERFIRQLPQNQTLLDNATHEQIRHCWRLLKAAGNALPQEKFFTLPD